MAKSMYSKMGVKRKGAKPGDLISKANKVRSKMSVKASAKVAPKAPKKISMKVALKKYEGTKMDKRQDKAGAKKLMAKKMGMKKK